MQTPLQYPQHRLAAERTSVEMGRKNAEVTEVVLQLKKMKLLIKSSAIKIARHAETRLQYHILEDYGPTYAQNRFFARYLRLATPLPHQSRLLHAASSNHYFLNNSMRGSRMRG